MKTILVEYADVEIYYKEYKSEELAKKEYLRDNKLGISCKLMNERELDILLCDVEDNKCACDRLYN